MLALLCLAVIGLVTCILMVTLAPRKLTASSEKAPPIPEARSSVTRVLMYPDWYAEVYNRISPHPNVEYVTSGPADGLIFINSDIPPTELVSQVPKGQIVGMAAEPVEFLPLNEATMEFIRTHVKQYLIGSLPPQVGPWLLHYGYMIYNHPTERKSWNQKSHLMSIIVGDRVFLPGHKYRHELADEIVRRGLPVHIWGRGSAQYATTHQWTRGEFTDLEPYEDYQYTIAVENVLSTCYISEKYTNAIACNTIPVYFGANDVVSYFGNNWGLRLYGDLTYDIRLIENIVKHPTQYQLSLDEAYYELKQGKAALGPFVLKQFGSAAAHDTPSPRP